jgi:hypothetical protein
MLIILSTALFSFGKYFHKFGETCEEYTLWNKGSSGVFHQHIYQTLPNRVFHAVKNP